MNAIRKVPSNFRWAPCSADWGVADTHRTGFLVVAPDRRYLVNEEVQAIFQEFETSYAPASLALIGRDDNGLQDGIEQTADALMSPAVHSSAGRVGDESIAGRMGRLPPPVPSHPRRPE